MFKVKRDKKIQESCIFRDSSPMYYIPGTNLLEIHNKCYEDISIAKDLSTEVMLKFSKLVQIQGQLRILLKGNISGGKEMTENINNTRTEIEFASFEDPLNMPITSSNEATLVSEISARISKENVIITPGQGKIPVFISSDEV